MKVDRESGSLAPNGGKLAVDREVLKKSVR
jgi:hypothetical protein